jgi:hypothetical protein
LKMARVFYLADLAQRMVWKRIAREVNQHPPQIVNNIPLRCMHFFGLRRQFDRSCSIAHQVSSCNINGLSL